MPSNNILAIIEFRGGQMTKSGPEILGQGKRLAATLGGDLLALVMGEGVTVGAAGLGEYGVSKVHVADNAAFGAYLGDLQGRVAMRVLKTVDPSLVLLPATSQGKDLAPRLAAGIDAGLAVDCTAVDLGVGGLTAQRPVYAGKAIQTVSIAAAPYIASRRPNVFPAGEAEAGKTAEVETLDIAEDLTAVKSTLKEVKPPEGDKIELTEADVIVAGGRGMKEAGNFQLLENLADALGAAVGASRAVVDAGWRPHSEQVGQTGKTVGPNLYFAVGISGAIQHMAGMSTSKCIVAVNKDPEAPIFKTADYGIVGDALKVLPVLTEAVKKLKE